MKELNSSNGVTATGEEMRSVLLNYTYGSNIYQDKVIIYNMMRYAAKMFIKSPISTFPLTLSVITRYWDSGYLALEIPNRDTDFCDFCTNVYHNLQNLNSNNERCSVRCDLLSKHINGGSLEHDNY